MQFPEYEKESWSGHGAWIFVGKKMGCSLMTSELKAVLSPGVLFLLDF